MKIFISVILSLTIAIVYTALPHTLYVLLPIAKSSGTAKNIRAIQDSYFEESKLPQDITVKTSTSGNAIARLYPFTQKLHVTLMGPITVPDHLDATFKQVAEIALLRHGPIQATLEPGGHLLSTWLNYTVQSPDFASAAKSVRTALAVHPEFKAIIQSLQPGINYFDLDLTPPAHISIAHLSPLPASGLPKPLTPQDLKKNKDQLHAMVIELPAATGRPSFQQYLKALPTPSPRTITFNKVIVAYKEGKPPMSYLVDKAIPLISPRQLVLPTIVPPAIAVPGSPGTYIHMIADYRKTNNILIKQKIMVYADISRTLGNSVPAIFIRTMGL